MRERIRQLVTREPGAPLPHTRHRTAPDTTGAVPPVSIEERHYTVPQLAEKWSLSDDVVRAMFRDRPGVLKIGQSRLLRRAKRNYVTLRIPASVAEAVYRELSE